MLGGSWRSATARAPLSQVLLDDDPDDGLAYVEDVGLSNLKLVVGFAGVGASLVSHVYPAPFPKNWLVLLLCCAWYFLMSGILQLILSFCELESILLVRGKAGKEGLNFSSHLPRFQEMYTLGITPLPKGSLGLASAPKFRPMEPNTVVETSADGSQKQWPVNLFFDEEVTNCPRGLEPRAQQTAPNALLSRLRAAAPWCRASLQRRPSWPMCAPSSRPSRAKSHDEGFPLMNRTWVRGEWWAEECERTTVICFQGTPSAQASRASAVGPRGVSLRRTLSSHPSSRLAPPARSRGRAIYQHP